MFWQNTLVSLSSLIVEVTMHNLSRKRILVIKSASYSVTGSLSFQCLYLFDFLPCCAWKVKLIVLKKNNIISVFKKINDMTFYKCICHKRVTVILQIRLKRDKKCQISVWRRTSGIRTVMTTTTTSTTSVSPSFINVTAHCSRDLGVCHLLLWLISRDGADMHTHSLHERPIKNKKYLHPSFTFHHSYFTNDMHMTFRLITACVQVTSVSHSWHSRKYCRKLKRSFNGFTDTPSTGCQRGDLYYICRYQLK